MSCRRLNSISGFRPVRVRLKGLHRATKKLANGQVVTYWYAWRGGPRLAGQPGSPEFAAAHHEAVIQKLPSRVTGTLQDVINGYQASAAFRGLAERTQKDYGYCLRRIEAAFGDFPVTALSDKRTRGLFREWRDRISMRSTRNADYLWAVLQRVLSWGLDGGLVDCNPCTRGGRVYHGTRADKIWTAEDQDAFMAVASPQMQLAFMLGVWTGQRQGDLLRLPWSSYEGGKIRLKQGKTGRRVAVPVAGPLKRLLELTPRRGPMMLTDRRGRPWVHRTFKYHFSITRAKARITGLTFGDLRGTFVTRAAVRGATEPEIAAITGHSMADVRRILDHHYLHRDPRLAENAMRKLEGSQDT